MQQNFAFQPRGYSQISAASSTSGAVTASATQITLPSVPQEGGTIRLANIGSQTIFWLIGNVAVTTSGTAMGIPMLANTVETFSIPGGISQISVIAASTGSTLYCTIGDGM